MSFRLQQDAAHCGDILIEAKGLAHYLRSDTLELFLHYLEIFLSPKQQLVADSSEGIDLFHIQENLLFWVFAWPALSIHSSIQRAPFTSGHCPMEDT